MRELYYLVKRDMLVFLRDRSAVFFSVLSMFIVLMLMIVFLGGMSSESVVNMLAEVGGERDALKDRENAEWLIQMWTLAGILVVNSVTVTLTVMQTMIQDEAKGSLFSFYTAPIKRTKVAFGYILASFFIGVGMCLLTLVMGEIYMVISGYSLLSLEACAKLFGMIVLNVFVYASVGYLVALFVHSESAWGGMLTVVGTLVGFVGGIYLPVSQLPDGVASVIKCLPVLHGAGMMRKICIQDAMKETFHGISQEVGDIFNEEMGVTIFMDGNEVTLGAQVLILLGYGIIAIAISVIISQKRKMHDR